MKKIGYTLIILWICAGVKANPIDALLERIDPGSSKKFKIEVVASNDAVDFFELDQYKDQVVVRGNNYVSIATGINWYLKYYVHIHLSWNGMKARLPEKLPVVKQKERHETNQKLRYYLNYCTFSYSMAFWDWERWEQEIDWMALHGINLSLAVTGLETVWYHILKEKGYTIDEINEFISGSGFMAFWQMGVLEGWGGPNPEQWYKQQAVLQKKVVGRMREYGIEPVFSGYSGMLPRNAKEKLGVDIFDPGKWCGYTRPAFLQPTDPAFETIADLYYREMAKLYGTANYYSMDPFHEGGSTQGIDLDMAGKSIMKTMKKANKNAIWVLQAWQDNPKPAMINNLNAGDLVILDLFCESRPQWGPEWSSWHRKDGFGQHNWVFSIVHNFGGRTGLFGKLSTIINEYYNARQHRNGQTLVGIGAAMEAIENNPVVYELLFELPWRPGRFSGDQWLAGYAGARYGKTNQSLNTAWNILGKTVYNCPKESTQEGTAGTVFAALPALDVTGISCCCTPYLFYNTDSVRMAAEKMLEVADQFAGNNNFEYDLIDVVRQTLANKAFYLQREVAKAYKDKNRTLYNRLKNDFLTLMLAEDSLLRTRPEFMLGPWVNQARKIGTTKAEKDLYEWNARTQITVWGTRNSAGMLHNYAFKEWTGMIRDVYYPRWVRFFESLESSWDGNPQAIDYFAMDKAWTRQHNPYPNTSHGDPVRRSKEIYNRYVKNE